MSKHRFRTPPAAWPVSLTADETVLLTSCLWICSSMFIGEKPEPIIVKMAFDLGSSTLPELNKKLDVLWDQLLPDIPRPGEKP